MMLALSNNQEEEYHFSELEESESYGIEQGDAVVQESRLKRLVVFAILLFVVALGVYKLLGVFFGDGLERKLLDKPAVVAQKPEPIKTVATKPAVTAAKPVFTPVVKPVQKSAQKPVRKVKSTASTANTLALQETLKRVQNESEKERALLTSAVKSLHGTLAEYTQRLNDMDKNLQALKAKLASHEIKTKRLINKRKQRRRLKKRAVVSRKLLNLKAAIPGRAWIKVSDGTTISVKVGEKVRGYGRVREIDPYEGRVIMSTGDVIHYSQDER